MAKSLYKWISIMDRLNKTVLSEDLVPLDINTSQYMFILQIYQHGQIPQDELMNVVHIDKSNVTRTLQKLIEKGLVQREHCPTDHRAYVVSLTAKGKTLYKPIFEAEFRRNAVMLANLSVDEEAELYRLLDKISAAVDEPNLLDMDEP